MPDNIPPGLIRDLALSACRDTYPADPCTEPCDICWQEAEALLRERDRDD